MEEPIEEWKYIKGTKNKYQISNHGRVKSFCKFPEGRILTLRTTNYGNIVSFNLKHFRKEMKIELLVAEYFLPNPINEYFTDVKHKDGNRCNDLVTNLEWVEKNLCRTKYLRVSDIIDIYNRCWYSDEPRINIAKEYNINPTIVSSIKTGTRWGNITEDVRRLKKQ